MRRFTGWLRWSGVLALGLVLAACGNDGSAARVVLYCGVDMDQSQAIAQRYEEERSADVDFHGETEKMRSVGLPQRLMLERGRPRADVFWSNEIMHMVYLCNSGVMAPLPPGVADGFPAASRDPAGRYVAFGARARVLLVNTELLPDPKDRPTSVMDLLDPKYARMGLVTSMAEPLTGTTKTHAIVWLTRDEAGAKAFFERVAAAREQGAMRVVMSNGQVMRLVKEKGGKVAFGLTDTDDAWVAMQENPKLVIVYPDAGADEVGTLLIPNTAALVKGGPHPAEGAKLLRWLVSKENEARLAASRAAQIPLRPGVTLPKRPQLKWRPGVDFKTMPVDWHAVGDNVDRWAGWLARVFKP